MSTAIQKATRLTASANKVLVTSNIASLSEYLDADELKHVKAQHKKDVKAFTFNKLSHQVFVRILSAEGEAYKQWEAARKSGAGLQPALAAAKITDITVVDADGDTGRALAVAEGMALANYQFLKYFKDKNDKQSSLTTIKVFCTGLTAAAVEQLEVAVSATCVARTLVNEPLSYLTAVQLSKEIQKLGKEAGFKTEVFNKKKIESLKMGGVLAVNRGSLDPPTFSIMEWKPKGARNTKPIVLVGKGIVYDTGGLSLKPTANSMDFMKSDMAGSAAVIGTVYAVAKAKLPLHVIGLVPATDNRPGVNAYAPGDVITMYSGSTVEVLNTDAEGRLVLADALHYAQKYQPELVIDLATLTGAAVRAVGLGGIASMGSADDSTMSKLAESGRNVYERLAPQPFWDEFADELKSHIADLTNLGSINAGQVTAGKFLEHFTKDKKGKHAYPWIHLDIAGPSFLHAADSYRGKHGTGVGVRLLFDFLKSYA